MPADPSELALRIFRIRPDEAIVYVGPTPPQGDHFGSNALTVADVLFQ